MAFCCVTVTPLLIKSVFIPGGTVFLKYTWLGAATVPVKSHEKETTEEVADANCVPVAIELLLLVILNVRSCCM